MNPQPNNLTNTQEFMPNFCDKCGNRYSSTDYETVSKDEGKTIYRVTCKKCHNSFLMHFSTPVAGVATSLRMPFRSAITTNEIKKFSLSDKIASNEALDVYISLKEVKTIKDFNNLFRTKVQ